MDIIVPSVERVLNADRIWRDILQSTLEYASLSAMYVARNLPTIVILSHTSYFMKLIERNRNTDNTLVIIIMYMSIVKTKFFL